MGEKALLLRGLVKTETTAVQEIASECADSMMRKSE